MSIDVTRKCAYYISGFLKYAKIEMGARTGILRIHAQSQNVNKRCVSTDISWSANGGENAYSIKMMLQTLKGNDKSYTNGWPRKASQYFYNRNKCLDKRI